MERIAATIGIFALVAGLGALAIAQLVIVPGLDRSALVDANLAKTLAAPLHLRCAEIVMGGAIALAIVAYRWMKTRVATTLALVATGGAALYRIALLPRMYEAWGRADLVAGRPHDRIAEAQHLAEQSELLAIAIGIVLVTLAVLAVNARPVRAWRRATVDTPPTIVEPSAAAATMA